MFKGCQGLKRGLNVLSGLSAKEQKQSETVQSVLKGLSDYISEVSKGSKMVYYFKRV